MSAGGASGGGVFDPTKDYTPVGDWAFTGGKVSTTGPVTMSGTVTITGATTLPSATALTSPVLTTPTITSPVLSGSGVPQVAIVNLAGAAWHTGVGAANCLNWQNVTGGVVIISRVFIYIATGSTGAATVAAGTTTTNNHTASDNQIDDYNLQTTGVYSNMNKTDTEVTEITLANNGWVTFTASADPTGTVGNAYIQFMQV